MGSIFGNYKICGVQKSLSDSTGQGVFDDTKFSTGYDHKKVTNSSYLNIYNSKGEKINSDEYLIHQEYKITSGDASSYKVNDMGYYQTGDIYKQIEVTGNNYATITFSVTNNSIKAKVNLSGTIKNYYNNGYNVYVNFTDGPTRPSSWSHEYGDLALPSGYGKFNLYSNSSFSKLIASDIDPDTSMRDIYNIIKNAGYDGTGIFYVKGTGQTNIDSKCKLVVKDGSNESTSSSNSMSWDLYALPGAQETTYHTGWFVNTGTSTSSGCASAPWTNKTKPDSNTYYSTYPQYIITNQWLRVPHPQQAFSYFRDKGSSYFYNNGLTDYLWFKLDDQGWIFSHWNSLGGNHGTSAPTDTGIMFTGNNQSIYLYPQWERANNVSYKIKNESLNLPFPYKGESGIELDKTELKRFHTYPSMLNGSEEYQGYNYAVNKYIDDFSGKEGYNILSYNTISPEYKDGYIYNIQEYGSFSIGLESNLFFRFYDIRPKNSVSENEKLFNKNWKFDKKYNNWESIGWNTPSNTIGYNDTVATLDCDINYKSYPILFGGKDSNSEKREFSMIKSINPTGTEIESELIKYDVNGDNYLYISEIGGQEKPLSSSSYGFLWKIDSENSTKEINYGSNAVTIKLEKLDNTWADDYYDIDRGFTLSKIKVSPYQKLFGYTSDLTEITDKSFTKNENIYSISFEIDKSKVCSIYQFTPIFTPKSTKFKCGIDSSEIEGNLPQDVTLSYWELFNPSKFNAWKSIKLKNKQNIIGWQLQSTDEKIFNKDFEAEVNCVGNKENSNYFFNSGSGLNYSKAISGYGDELVLVPITEYPGGVIVYDDNYWRDACNIFVYKGPNMRYHGDFDGDGVISQEEAQLALEFSGRIKTPTPEELLIADVDGDGVVSTSDATAILRVAGGLQTIESLGQVDIGWREVPLNYLNNGD